AGCNQRRGAGMSITVRELLQLPHLRLTLTAGQGGLDHQVSWVHSSDLPDPWEWLGPAELLLTNGTSLSAEEEAQVHFIERRGAALPGRPRDGDVDVRRRSVHLVRAGVDGQLRRARERDPGCAAAEPATGSTGRGRRAGRRGARRPAHRTGG